LFGQDEHAPAPGDNHTPHDMTSLQQQAWIDTATPASCAAAAETRRWPCFPASGSISSAASKRPRGPTTAVTICHW